MSRAGAAALFTVGLVLVGVAIAGTAGSWGSQTTTYAVAPPPVPPTTAASNRDAAVLFVGDLDRATAAGETDWLLDHLHPAVIARYGRAQCRAYVAKLAGTRTTYVPSGRAMPVKAYQYTTDGDTSVVTDVVAVPAARETQAGNTPALLHFAVVDGTYRWFTDCGTPIK